MSGEIPFDPSQLEAEKKTEVSIVRKNEFECSQEELDKAISQISRNDLEVARKLQELWERSRSFEGVTVESLFPWIDNYLSSKFPGIYRSGDIFNPSDSSHNWVTNYYYATLDQRPTAVGAYRGLNASNPEVSQDRYIKYNFYVQDQLQAGHGSLAASWRLGPLYTDQQGGLESRFVDPDHDIVSLDGESFGVSLRVNPIERIIIRNRVNSQTELTDAIAKEGERSRLAKQLILVSGDLPEEIEPTDFTEEFKTIVDRCIAASANQLPNV